MSGRAEWQSDPLLSAGRLGSQWHQISLAARAHSCPNPRLRMEVRDDDRKCGLCSVSPALASEAEASGPFPVGERSGRTVTHSLAKLHNPHSLDNTPPYPPHPFCSQDSLAFGYHGNGFCPCSTG